MIQLKSPDEIEFLARANGLVGECLALAREMVRPGISTAEINEAVEKHIADHDAIPAFKGYKLGPGIPPFPSACCMSIDEEVVHGFPREEPLEEGMILSVDIGVRLDGWHGDAARTFMVGDVPDEKRKLVEATEKARNLGIKVLKSGNHLSDFGHEVQKYVEKRGFSVVRDLVGHGIGQNLHEEPQVPNYGKKGKGLKLREGLVLAVEPMINLGTYRVKVLSDHWTVVTADAKPSAHFEHTVAITANGPRVLSNEP